MAMLPLVSVVIPYYNDEKYIHETLESIQHQTYKNVEVILVDDGSTEKESIRIFDDLKKIGFQTYRQKMQVYLPPEIWVFRIQRENISFL